MLLLNYAPVLRQPTGIGVYANAVLPALQKLPHVLIAGGQEGTAPQRLKRLVWSQAQLPQLARRHGASLIFTPAPEGYLGTQKLQLTAQEGKRGGTSGFARVLAGGKDTPGSVLLHDGKTLQLRPFARDGRKLTLGDAAWKVPIGEKGSPQPPADDARELLIANERELLFVRWQ